MVFTILRLAEERRLQEIELERKAKELELKLRREEAAAAEKAAREQEARRAAEEAEAEVHTTTRCTLDSSLEDVFRCSFRA